MEKESQRIEYRNNNGLIKILDLQIVHCTHNHLWKNLKNYLSDKQNDQKNRIALGNFQIGIEIWKK